MPPIATDESLAAFLADRDVACPACGYNLRGLTSAHCPECRQHLVMTVSLSEPPMIQFILAVIGLAACGAAAGVTLFCVVVASVLSFGFPRGEEAVLLLWMPADPRPRRPRRRLAPPPRPPPLVPRPIEKGPIDARPRLLARVPHRRHRLAHGVHGGHVGRARKLPLPLGEGRGEDRSCLPLPVGEGRGEGRTVQEQIDSQSPARHAAHTRICLSDSAQAGARQIQRQAQRAAPVRKPAHDEDRQRAARSAMRRSTSLNDPLI